MNYNNTKIDPKKIIDVPLRVINNKTNPIMKKIIISTLIAILTTMLIYLAIGFMKYELDVSKWQGIERVMLVIFSLLFGTMLVGIYLQTEYEKEQKEQKEK
jgi:putative effector of murein hydrolase LrgA (UPF0299 family)